MWKYIFTHHVAKEAGVCITEIGSSASSKKYIYIYVLHLLNTFWPWWEYWRRGYTTLPSSFSPFPVTLTLKYNGMHNSENWPWIWNEWGLTLSRWDLPSFFIGNLRSLYIDCYVKRGAHRGWLHSNNNHQEQVTCHTDASSPEAAKQIHYAYRPASSSTFCLDRSSAHAERSVEKHIDCVIILSHTVIMPACGLSGLSCIILTF